MTGCLGGSALGLALLERRIRPPRDAASRRLAAAAVARYRRPEARLSAARLLARSARALIDVSDGVGLDLPRLARASGCGFAVDAARLPIDPAAARLLPPAAARRLALGGGEDFELLAAVPPGRLPGLLRRLAAEGIPATPIGWLLPAAAGGRLRVGGSWRRWVAAGWDPFRAARRSGLDAAAPRSVFPGGRRRPAAG